MGLIVNVALVIVLVILQQLSTNDVKLHIRLFSYLLFQIMSGSTYDRLFHMESGYNNKLHRDDREHAKSRGLKVHDEVSKNTVVAVVDPKPGNLVKFLPPQFFKGPH